MSKMNAEIENVTGPEGQRPDENDAMPEKVDGSDHLETTPIETPETEQTDLESPLSKLGTVVSGLAQKVESVVEAAAEKAQLAAANAVLAVTEPLIKKEGESDESDEPVESADAESFAAQTSKAVTEEESQAVAFEPVEPITKPIPIEGEGKGEQASFDEVASTNGEPDGAVVAPTETVAEAIDALPTEPVDDEIIEAVAAVPSTETDESEGMPVERVETEADARAEVSLDADEEFVIKVPKRKKAAPKADKAEKTDKPKAARKSSKKAEKLPDPGDGSGYEAPQTAEGVDATEDSYWYAVHCYSGYENKVKHNLEQRIETMGMAGKILEVVVPTEDEIEVRDGKRRTVERRVFPGYVMVHMKMSEESWHVVRNTPGVTRFIGMGNRPQPLSPQEVNQIVRRMEAEAPKIKVNYRIGQKVRITDGPFADFMGLVDKIDTERAKVSVLVSFFGRETPVELDFLQVEKM